MCMCVYIYMYIYIYMATGVNYGPKGPPPHGCHRCKRPGNMLAVAKFDANYEIAPQSIWLCAGLCANIGLARRHHSQNLHGAF